MSHLDNPMYLDYLEKKKQKELSKASNVAIDLQEQINDVLAGNNRSYDKKTISPEQRINLTILAEKNNLATYTDEIDGVPYFVITKSKNEETDINSLTVDDINFFFKILKYNIDSSLYFTEGTFNKVLFIVDMNLLGYSDKFKLFTDSLTKYGRVGIKRRNEILSDAIINSLKNSDKYKNFIKSTPTINGNISPPYSVFNKVYIPENKDRLFISIDIRAAIFQAYHNLGIIEENNWVDYLSKFTCDKLLYDDKCFRSKIFSKLDKNKSYNVLINNLIIDIWTKIKDKFADRLCVMEGDEIFIFTNNYTDDVSYLDAISIPKYARVQVFKLVPIYNDKLKTPAYVKEYLYPNKELFDVRCVNDEYRKDIYTQYLEIRKSN